VSFLKHTANLLIRILSCWTQEAIYLFKTHN